MFILLALFRSCTTSIFPYGLEKVDPDFLYLPLLTLVPTFTLCSITLSTHHRCCSDLSNPHLFIGTVSRFAEIVLRHLRVQASSARPRQHVR